MPLSKTFYADANVALPDTSTALLIVKSMLWTIKALLCGQATGTNGTNGAPPAGALWTVVNSSDSASAASSDLWGGTFNATKLVRAAAGSAHSWIQLQSPAGLGTVYLLIDWGTGSDNQVNILFSRFAFTGGTNLARPTSGSEVGYTNAGAADLTTGVVHRMTRVVDANGMFYLLKHRAAGAIFDVIFAFTQLAETQTGDNYKEAMLWEASASGRGAGAGVAGALLSFSSSGGVCMRSFDNNYGSDQGQNQGFILPSSSSFSGMAIPNAINSKADVWPLYVSFRGGSGSSTGIRGKWPDMGLVNSWKQPGDTEPSSGATTRVIVGNLLVPNDGTTPLL